MAAGLHARGIRPGDHVAILGPTSRDLVTAIQATWLAGATVVVLPLPMRMSSIDEFVAQTRERVLGADTTLLLLDPDLAPYIERRPGDPPSVCFGDLPVDDPFVAPRHRPVVPRGHPVHERLHVGPEGGDAPARHHRREPRRHHRGHHVHGGRRAGLVAAALPRHGSGRDADPAHDDRRRPRPRVPAGLHGGTVSLDGVAVDLRRDRDGRAELRVGARDPGARADGHHRPLAAPRRPQRRRTRRPRNGRGVHRCGPAPRPPSGRGLPRLRDGRGVDRRDLPGAHGRPADRRRRPARARDRGLRRAVRTRRPARPPAREAGPPHPRSAGPHRRSGDGTAPARARGGRARDPRHLGDVRVLQAARGRPPRRSGRAGSAPATSPT